jgi:hypothetical protein
MNRLRSRLTYANVMVTVLAFVVLAGGTAYAATEMLPKDSVGTKQLKKEAVTPSKLSKGAKKTLTGATGPQGPAGAVGKEGPAGKEGHEGRQGPQGPGAITFEAALPTTKTEIRTFGGVTVYGYCAGGEANLVFTGQGGSRLDIYGTRNYEGKVYSVDLTEESELGLFGPTIDTDLVSRSSPGVSAFTRFDLHASGLACKVVGMVTPSAIG